MDYPLITNDVNATMMATRRRSKCYRSKIKNLFAPSPFFEREIFNRLEI